MQEWIYVFCTDDFNKYVSYFGGFRHILIFIVSLSISSICALLMVLRKWCFHISMLDWLSSHVLSTRWLANSVCLYARFQVVAAMIWKIKEHTSSIINEVLYYFHIRFLSWCLGFLWDGRIYSYHVGNYSCVPRRPRLPSRCVFGS